MSDPDAPERIQLSGAQVAASCLAAITAAVLCSFFGVAGTVIGTAATSVVATVGSAIYGYSLRRTKNRLRRLHQAGAASPPVPEVVKTARENLRHTWQLLPTRALAIGAVGVFVVSIGVITVIELGLGEPLAAAIGFSDDSSRTSVGIGGHRHTNSSPSPNPTSTSTSTSSSGTSPSSHPTTSSPNPTPTATRTVTGSPTPTQSPTPSSSPTGIIPSLTSTRSH